MAPLLVLAIILTLAFAARRTQQFPTALLIAVGLAALVVAAGADWIVHPLAGVTLAVLASTVFSTSKRRNLPLVAAVVLTVVLLALLGADWIVHPAGGITLALLASVIFANWRKHLPTVALAAVMLALFTILGAGWLVHPLAAIALAWFAKAAFSGELNSRKARPARHAPAAPAALPSQTGGVPIDAQTFTPDLREPVTVGSRVGRATKRSRAASATQPTPDPTPTPGVTHELNDLIQAERDRLPVETLPRLRDLTLSIREANLHLTEHGQQDSESALLIQQIATDYAPGAIRAYLRLPPSTADVTPLQDGKTGRDLLIEQLDMLLDAVQRVMKDATVASAQEILTHQRFLEAKFREEKDFDI